MKIIKRSCRFRIFPTICPNCGHINWVNPKICGNCQVSFSGNESTGLSASKKNWEIASWTARWYNVAIKALIFKWQVYSCHFLFLDTHAFTAWHLSKFKLRLSSLFFCLTGDIMPDNFFINTDNSMDWFSKFNTQALYQTKEETGNSSHPRLYKRGVPAKLKF